ncbi:MAG: PVC-type heme-binding CxxCH protein [Planctomycetaceae bacterium]
MIVSTFMVLCTLLLQPPSDTGDLIKSIERQQGGRHWIDQPTEPPKSPDESLACFQIEPGYRIELIAAEPIITDPVAIDFDHLGRMFVVEYTDYPVGPKDSNAPPLSQVVLLEDLDSDGRMDKRTVFADHLKFCHSLMAFRSGILACTETQIMYLADSDGDNVADVREVWFDGFTPAHPQMQIGCPRWGFDNWIYLTYGHGKVQCRRPGFESKEAIEIPRIDFRFHPDTMQFEAISGAGQFGNTIDNFGHRFFSSNRNPIMTDVLSLDLVRRNPFAGVAVGHTDVGPSGEKTQVFPLVAMKSNYLSHAGTHTSACGVTACRGGQFGEESDRSIFVCEPVGHLITRSVIEQKGGTVTARRAREKADFLASTDTWFRPASLATGPDGALYVADMYRLWVEHPKFVPDDVAAKMDWRAGENRGRVWRIVREDAASVEGFSPAASPDELVELLRDRNGWRRMLGQRLIVESHRVECETSLRALLDDIQSSGFARLHALWTLDGLNLLQPADLVIASQDLDANVRRDVAKLISTHGPDSQELQHVAAMLCNDLDGEVRMQALLSLDPSTAEAKSAVLKSVPGCLDDLWLQRALLIAAPNLAADMAEVVVLQSGEATEIGGRADFLKSLALNVAARGEIEQLQKTAVLIGDGKESGLWWQTALVIGLAEGLPRCENADVPKNLAALLQSPPEDLKESLQAAANVVQLAADTAIDPKHSDADRIAAMGLMSHLPPQALTKALQFLLQPAESTACQQAAIEAARRSGRPELSEIVLTHWDQLKPQTRSAALDLLLLRKESVTSLLGQMATGVISSSVVSIDQRLILLRHPDETIRTTAIQLFGGTVSANRKEVADQYAKSLDLKGDVARGAAVFEKTCSKCHRIGGVGHNVGPDISDTRARARDALLYDILDPNRRVDPQFTEYIAVTTDGRLFNGLLIAESTDSVTLRQPEGREQTIQRTDIEDFKTTSKSLMPEGVERDVSVEQMADVLEFLKGR